MSYIDNLLEDFTKHNVLLWTKDIFYFFINPREFIRRMDATSSSEIIPQYAFYFFIFACSFLFLMIENSFVSAIKPAILSLVTSLVAVLFFTFTTFLVTHTIKIKRIAIYIFSVFLFTTPALLIFYSEFLSSENYIYKLWTGVIFSVVELAALVLFPFVIEQSRKSAWKVFGVTFSIVNTLWLIGSFIKFDSYEQNNLLYNYDPIISEYGSTYEALSSRDSIPVVHVFYKSASGWSNYFLTKNVADTGKFASGGIENNRNYVASIKENLKVLDKSISSAKFNRNRMLFLRWRDYFQIVITLTNFSGDAIQLDKMIADGSASVERINGVDRLVSHIDIRPVAARQLLLKQEHNNLVKSFNYAQIPILISDRLRFILGYLIEGIYLKYFQDLNGKPYRDQFLEIESNL
jgi:hypothetical protein